MSFVGVLRPSGLSSTMLELQVTVQVIICGAGHRTPIVGLQETHYELLLAGSFLTEEERDVLAWGCNAKVTTPPRFKNNGKAKLTYKHATAMEVLVRPLSFSVMWLKGTAKLYPAMSRRRLRCCHPNKG